MPAPSTGVWQAEPTTIVARCDEAPSGFRNYYRARLPAKLAQDLHGPSMRQLQPTSEGHCLPTMGLMDDPVQGQLRGNLPQLAELAWRREGARVYAFLTAPGALAQWQEPPVQPLPQSNATVFRERAHVQSQGATCFATLRDDSGATWALLETGVAHVWVEGQVIPLYNVSSHADRQVYSNTVAHGLMGTSLELSLPDFSASRWSFRHKAMDVDFSSQRNAPYQLTQARHVTRRLQYEDPCASRIAPQHLRSWPAALGYWLAH